MSDEGGAFLCGTVCGAVLMLLLCIIAHTNNMKDFKDEAVELGHAEYDSKTGVWQWKSEIKTEK